MTHRFGSALLGLHLLLLWTAVGKDEYYQQEETQHRSRMGGLDWETNVTIGIQVYRVFLSAVLLKLFHLFQDIL